MEYKERNDFPRHGRAWGAPHRGPRIRFICTSDAIDDPDNKGSWTTLLLWNKWRYLTYKDKREAESSMFWVVLGLKMLHCSFAPYDGTSKRAKVSTALLGRRMCGHPYL